MNDLLFPTHLMCSVYQAFNFRKIKNLFVVSARFCEIYFILQVLLYTFNRFFPTGKFSFKFDASGEYYYSSEVVNGEDALEPIYMKGVVYVSSKTSFAAELSVKVGDVEAEYKYDTDLGNSSFFQLLWLMPQ